MPAEIGYGTAINLASDPVKPQIKVAAEEDTRTREVAQETRQRDDVQQDDTGTTTPERGQNLNVTA